MLGSVKLVVDLTHRFPAVLLFALPSATVSAMMYVCTMCTGRDDNLYLALCGQPPPLQCATGSCSENAEN